MRVKTFAEGFALLGWDRKRQLEFHLQYATWAEAVEALARELAKLESTRVGAGRTGHCKEGVAA
jgi:hypothetical protein